MWSSQPSSGGGIPGRLLEAWVEGDLSLVLSPAIMKEYRRIGEELGKHHPERKEVWDSILVEIAAHAVLVDAPDLEERVSEDPDDDKFIACARAARPCVIVSGDRDLLDVSGWNDIEVLTPRQFYEQHLRKDR